MKIHRRGKNKVGTEAAMQRETERSKKHNDETTGMEKKRKAKQGEPNEKSKKEKERKKRRGTREQKERGKQRKMNAKTVDEENNEE